MRPDAATRTAPVRLAAMTLPIAGVLLMSVQPSAAQDARNAASNTGSTCAGDNGGITLSPGFCATEDRQSAALTHHPITPWQITLRLLSRSARNENPEYSRGDRQPIPTE